MPPLRMLGFMLVSFFATLLRRAAGRRLQPSWPFMFEVVVGAMRRSGRTIAKLPIEDGRRFQDQMGAASPKLPVVREAAEIGGVEVEWFRPASGASAPGVLVYLHGGAYLYGSSKSHGEIVSRMAMAADMEVCALNYRLAPEHSMEDAVEDVLAVHRQLLSEHPAGALVWAGDSAGGGLALLGMMAARDAGTDLPSCAALLAPWTDLRCAAASMESNEGIDWGSAALLRSQAAMVAGTRPLDDPALSPVFGDLHGLPPIVIHAGEGELIRDDVVALGAGLEDAGVPHELVLWPEMVHCFQFFAQFLPLAQESIDGLARFIAKHRAAA